VNLRPPPDLPEIPPGPPLLIVLSGQSGAGKDSIRDLLMEWELPLHFAVTATTRPKRPGEVEGRDYHFVNDTEWQQLEELDGFIEQAIVYGQRKGVPRSEVLEPLSEGRDVLVRVDIQGAETLRHLVPEAVLIFVAAPTMEEAQRRLVKRDTESEEEQRLRSETAALEVEASRYFDHVVVNETERLGETARQVVEIIAEEKRRRTGH
jgi:guanylate kinase